MRIPYAYVVIFFLACIVTGAVISFILISLPPDVHAVCDPYVNATRYEVNSFCTCVKEINWP
jgi:hypothetical protein